MRRTPKLPRWQAVIVAFVGLFVVFTVWLSFGMWPPHLPLKQSAEWAVVMAVALTVYAYRHLGKKPDVNK